MHRPPYTGELTLAYILGKIDPVKYSAKNPVTYSTSDVVKARSVLLRLTSDFTRNEVVSVKEVVACNNEI